ncbi:MAG: 4-(cytidine 5'-diphospho)-2-C-methyl-D-erythritol kinase [Neisseria sp.]|nr:4-(cytidine 5'-diphospho)-2-C-methyl-D-erythritol kinase [Neisseria sp.]
MNIPASAQAFPAPAKLNLDLRITGRRADGYHNLESIFCLIDLQDTVYLAPLEDGKIILHTPTDGIAPEQDLAYRAAAALQAHLASPLGVEIWLDKRIPTGGGLGGGSSDAATVLLALNRLWQGRLKTEELIEIGVTLGADVPFFLFGRNAFAKGIGEKLQQIDVPKQWYVVARPDVHVATGKIFSHERLTRNSEPSIMPTFQSLQPFRNDMQQVVLEEYKEVADLYCFLEQFGKPLMTGSGSCVFLTFGDLEAAKAVSLQVAQKYQVYLAEGLQEHPLSGK